MTVRAMIAVTIAVGVSSGFLTGWLTRSVAAQKPMTTKTDETKVAVKPKDDPTYKDKIKPFLDTYCNACHNSDKASGGVALDVYASEAHARKDRKNWELIQKVVLAGEMPPKKSKKQPKPEDKAFFTDWIGTALTKVDCTAPKDPGRVTMRRLNRAEFNNTIRDLLGVDVQPANDFPNDDVGYGFDNIGDVLSIQPLMIEKYMAAADKVLDAAIPNLEPVASSTQRFNKRNLPVFPPTAKVPDPNAKGEDAKRLAFGKIVLTEPGHAFLDKFNFPAEGDYILRISAWGEKFQGESPKLAFRVDGKEQSQQAIEAERSKPKSYEAKVRMTPGTRRIEVAFVNPAADKKSRIVGIDSLEVEGPLNANVEWPAATKKLLGDSTARGDQTEAARKILTDLTRRAFRRPVKADEVEKYIKLFKLAESKGDNFESAIRLPIKAILVSPHFLFRIEDDPKNPDDVKLISEHELATRLSYFLWSSMPDDELFRLAEKGELRKPGVLATQVKRMLKDPKATSLTENFAGQWLMLRSIAGLTPDKATFPKWGENIRAAAVRETDLFFQHIVKEDRSVLEFLDSDYTFLNQTLAEFYGIPNVSGSEFRKVQLKDRRRGGLVTQASMLLVTSNPTRTSPVKRGKWIYENILGLTAPPPPPDVPELPPTPELKGTVRQQLEQHRDNPNCAVCHNKLDPLGFGLENFDAIGYWRETDNKVKIDASGVLPDGAKFSGPNELKKVLLAKSDLFRHCFAEKLTTFALGRGLEYYDKCVLDDLQAKLKAGGDKFSALALAIVESEPFQKRRGKRSE